MAITVDFQILTLPIVVPIMEKDLKLTKLDKVLIGQTFFIGSALGCMVAGYVGDKYGRKVSLASSNILCILFGYLSSYCDSGMAYFVARIMVGVFTGMIILLTHTYLDEVAFKGWRQRNIVLYDVMYQVGGILFTVIVGLCLDQVGQGDWRLLIKVSNVFLIVNVLLTMVMSESIKYQLEKQNFEQAFDNINWAIRFNDYNNELLNELEKQQIMEKYQKQEDQQEQIRQDDGFKAVYQSQYKYNLVFLCTQWFAINLVYYSIDWMIPVQLQRDFSGNKNIQKLFLTLNYVIELASASFVLLFLTKQWLSFQKLYLTFQGILLAILPIVCMITPKTYSLFVIKGPLNSTFVSVIVFGPSLFPTLIKSRALGIAQTFGRIGGILMPFMICCIVEFDTEIYLAYVFIIILSQVIMAASSYKFLVYPGQQKYIEFNDNDSQA